MRILAVETSCDDTGIAIVETQKNKPHFRVLANVISSQVKVHQKWGGIYPTLAKREHQKNLVPVLIKALNKAKLIGNSKFPPVFAEREIPNSKKVSSFKGVRPPVGGHAPFTGFQEVKNILNHEELLYRYLIGFINKLSNPGIDLIAVTIGPGLEPSLWVGVNFAKALAYAWNLPVVPINHVEAHILVNWLTPINANPKSALGFAEREILNPKQLFPAICLVVSGGHTQLILMKNIGKYEILGETRDDAAGECFDKAAKILGLGYPGGPAIAAEAAKLKNQSAINNQQSAIRLPRPMMYAKDYDFSFSGLKTAVLYDWKKRPAKIRKSKAYLQAMAAEIQQAIIDVLVYKTLKAAKNFRARTVILGGGVTANQELRRQIQKKISGELPAVNCFIPKVCYSTDNALMVAAAVFYGKKKPHRKWKNLEAKANLRL